VTDEHYPVVVTVTTRRPRMPGARPANGPGRLRASGRSVAPCVSAAMLPSRLTRCYYHDEYDVTRCARPASSQGVQRMAHGSDPSGSIADAALDLTALRAYLRRAEPSMAELGELTAGRLAGGRSNLTYLVTDGIREFVLRRPPLGTTPSRSYNLRREYRMLDMAAGAGVPVPRLVHLCEDPTVTGAAFMLTDRVAGVVLRDASDVAGLSEAERYRLCDELTQVLAQLHAADLEATAPDAYRRGKSFVERQVALWTEQWRLWRTQDLPQMEHVSRALQAGVPRPQRIGVVHGDFRFDNVIFDPALQKISAVLDWELAAVGDPLVDLGLLLAYWATDGSMAELLGHKRLTAAIGLSGNDVVKRYAKLSPLSLEALDFYVAFGYFKWAVIRAGVYRRQLEGVMPPEDSAALAASVEVIANRAFEIVESPGFSQSGT
jgi:aminoglycoside phosphotransferase (APT) family kinase protein